MAVNNRSNKTTKAKAPPNVTPEKPKETVAKGKKTVTKPRTPEKDRTPEKACQDARTPEKASEDVGGDGVSPVVTPEATSKNPKEAVRTFLEQEDEKLADTCRNLNDIGFSDIKEDDHDGIVQLLPIEGVDGALYIVLKFKPNNPRSGQFYGEKVSSCIDWFLQ